MDKRIRRHEGRPGEGSRELERENARLKKLVAYLSSDNAILKEAPVANQPGTLPLFWEETSRVAAAVREKTDEATKSITKRRQ
jgi:hypothetical protein